MAAIVAKGAPVYGINTGFGGSPVRIDAEDLETLQRNIVLSHAAGVGDPMPVDVARLMMALKLASLAQGASGVRPATLAMLEAMLARGLTPVIPSQGSVGASGDLAPLAHLAAAMMGVGEIFVAGERIPAEAASPRGAGAAEARSKGRAGAAERHTILDGLRARRAVRSREPLPYRAGHRRAFDRAAKGSDTPFDPRIHLLAATGQIETAAALRSLMAGSRDPRVASRRR